MVVVTRQIAQHVRLSLAFAGIAVFRHPLRFQASEKTFHRCVIPAVAPATHALFDPVAAQHLAEPDAGVMGGLPAAKSLVDRFGKAVRLFALRGAMAPRFVPPPGHGQKQAAAWAGGLSTSQRLLLA